MKVTTTIKILFVLFMLAIFTAGAKAQDVCPHPSGCITISQDAANKAAQLADRLAAAIETIEAFKLERTATVAERAAHTALVAKLKEINEVDALIITKHEYMRTIYEQVVKLQGEIIERMAKQLNRGKSPWDKFVSVLKTLANVALGVAIGRAGF